MAYVALLSAPLLAVLAAASNDGGTGVPYFNTVAAPVSVGAVLFLLWRIVRSQGKDQGTRIAQLHADITDCGERNRSLEERLDALNTRATDLHFANEVCEWRMELLIGVLERHAIVIPPEIRKQRRPPDGLLPGIEDR